MASAKHRGWLLNKNNGILGGVYNGAQEGASVLTTNTALGGVLVGTPVTPALAVDSLVLSNLVASGDILVAANNGGNSQAWLWVDASAGTMTLYGAGTAAAVVAATYVEVKDDILLGLGTGRTARFSWETQDANANALLLQMPAGGAVDVPVLAIGQSIEGVDLGLYNGVVDPRIALFGVGAVTTGPGLDFRKARGTIAAPTVVTTGDDVGTIRGYAAVAANEYVQTAEIRFDCAGTIATTRGPGTITFLTATDAAPSVLTQAMIISAAQLVTCAAGVTLTTGDLTLSTGNVVFSAAADITALANTAAALEITDGTTKLLAFDTRNTVTVQNTLFTAPASQTLPNGAASQFRHVSIAAHTVTLAGTTQVTTLNNGASLWIGAPTYNQSGGAVTVDQVSTLHVATPAAGASVTITAPRVISTDDVACYLSSAYVWTDKPSTRTVKQDIAPLAPAAMATAIEQIEPVQFRYDPARLGLDDFGRQRYGIIAEDLPDFLRAPGDRNPQAMSGTLLAAFSLAGLRYLHDANKALSARLAALETGRKGRPAAAAL